MPQKGELECRQASYLNLSVRDIFRLMLWYSTGVVFDLVGEGYISNTV